MVDYSYLFLCIWTIFNALLIYLGCFATWNSQLIYLSTIIYMPLFQNEICKIRTLSLDKSIITVISGKLKLLILSILNLSNIMFYSLFKFLTKWLEKPGKKDVYLSK